MSVAAETVYIGVGSNLDDPIAQVTRGIEALRCLPKGRVLAVSSLYVSPPAGPVVQPDFINAVVCLQTSLSPLSLLQALQQIEQQHHRKRHVKWGPRTLDLDILLYGKQRIEHAYLCVPHPELCQRLFCVVPLLEIAPEVMLPDGRALKAYQPRHVDRAMLSRVDDAIMRCRQR